MNEVGDVYRILFGSPNIKDHWEDLGVGGKITLKWTLGKYASIMRTGFNWLRIGSSVGLLQTRLYTFVFLKNAGRSFTS
jgi:hypothetical protein